MEDTKSSYVMCSATNSYISSSAQHHAHHGRLAKTLKELLVQNIGQILRDTPLARLIQKENFIGWVYSIDYEQALIMTNDLWKARVKGVPLNSFLLAASFDPDNLQSASEREREVILLRVTGSTKLPQDDDMVRTKIDHFQEQRGISADAGRRDYDDITLNQIQFGGLSCRVLGTFYLRDDKLQLGSDLESFAASTRLITYRPQGRALEMIVNYVDPLRKSKAQDDLRDLGISTAILPFRLGTVRYTSTDRLHRAQADDLVEVSIQPVDFLARRTAVLGMTRTGKSNLVKQVVSVVKKVADQSSVKIGQIIYDIDGEYANANQQDRGAIADVFPEDTKRYGMLPADGFEELQNNFYVQLSEGMTIFRRVLKEGGRQLSQDVENFLGISFEEPPKKEDQGGWKRWRVRVAAYQALLFQAEFAAPDMQRVYFNPNQQVKDAVKALASQDGSKSVPDWASKNPEQGLTLPEAREWFIKLREANKQAVLKSTSGGNWVDESLKAILNMMVNKNDMGTYINGYRMLAQAQPYHSPRRMGEVSEEIYGHLLNGRIVILDMSVGDAVLRENISKQIARYIFDRSMKTFVDGNTPPNIVVYIEEAHNLIGKDLDLTETWPRLAKEGAKYRIALVYATQEVSSVHPNVLANTENWFVSHLNNEREIRELARFYDFADFSKSLMRAQDVGFTRVKTLSGPFVIPVQVDKFDPKQTRIKGEER